MRKQLRSLEFARPLCGDCRDKCKGEMCLRCEIQRLQALVDDMAPTEVEKWYRRMLQDAKRSGEETFPTQALLEERWWFSMFGNLTDIQRKRLIDRACRGCGSLNTACNCERDE